MTLYVYTAGIPYWADWTSLTIRALLLKSGYTPDVDHDFVDDVIGVSNEAAGGTYVRKTLAGKTVTVDNTNNWVKYDATDITWTALTTAANDIITGCLIYNFVTNDADSIPMIYFNFAGVDPGGADFSVLFNTNGVLTALQG